MPDKNKKVHNRQRMVIMDDDLNNFCEEQMAKMGLKFSPWLRYVLTKIKRMVDQGELEL